MAKIALLMTNLFVRKLEHGADLKQVDRVDLAHLTRNASDKGAREVILVEGDPAPRMLVLLEGWACRYRRLDEGQRQITDLILPGDSCHPHVANLRHADYSLATVTPCKIAEINPIELGNLLERRPRVRQALIWSSQQAASILRGAVTNGRRQAERRIAHLICELRTRLDAVGLTEEDGFAWPLTQDDVGDVTALTSVHVNRTYREMRTSNLFDLKGRVMRIPDLERLSGYCGFRPDYLHLSGQIAATRTR
jgi:CRP-like cAMP-binding protein